MTILKEIQQRSTAQSFSGEAVDPQALKRILEAGRLAPSAKNRQVWRFIAVCREDLKNTLCEACYGDERLKTAGSVIAICTTNIDYTLPNGQLSHPLDLSFATSFMMLQAEHEELGTVVLSIYDEEKIKPLLSIPQSMQVLLLLAIGKRTDRLLPTIRFPIERIVSYEHW